MTWLEYCEALESVQVANDRRNDSRLRVLKQIRICQLDATGKAKEDEDVGTLIDLSRDGLFFTSQSHHYQIGMELQFTFPQTSSECGGEVVRMERRPNGHLGVGVRILGRQANAGLSRS
jgi:hypothetical protein